MQSYTMAAPNFLEESITFDGKDDYIELPEMEFDFSGGFTLEAWVYWESFPTIAKVIDLSNDRGSNSIILSNYNSTNRIHYSIDGSGFAVTETMELEKWFHEIEFMARQSVEGQAMELDWIAGNAKSLTDRDYFRMCVKKTCWYTFISPCRIGLIVGQPSSNKEDLIEPLANLTRFGMA